MVIKLKKHGIALKLMFAVILFSSMITLVTTALQLYRDYNIEISQIDLRLQEVEKVHLANISRSLWLADEQEMILILDGIYHLPDMQFLEIREGNKVWTSVGTNKEENVIGRDYALKFSHRGDELTIGFLKVVASLEGIYDRLIDKAILILLSNAIKTFLVAGFILFFFHYLVTRHLIDISRYLEQYGWDFDNENPGLNLNRTKKNEYDELDLLIDNINSLNKKLKESYQDLGLSEEKYRLAMNATSDGLWDYNVATNEVFYSSNWCRILQEEEVPGEFSSWESRIHPSDKQRILASLYDHLEGRTKNWEEEHRLHQKDGNWIWVLDRGKVIERNEEGEALRMVGTMTDISERKLVEEQLGYQATHDALTGLINRYEFERRTKRLLSSVTDDSDIHALLFMDLDQFKVINDVCGHHAGDELLRQVSQTLIGIVRKRDTLARLGGDEFSLLMEHCDLNQAERVATQILERLQELQFNWEGKSFRISISIGIVAIDGSTTNYSELLKTADSACFFAKDLGRNRFYIYRPDDKEISSRQGEMQWVSRINQALEEHRFCLFAQPILSLEDDSKSHYELLIRMVDEENQLVPPGAFLPAAERYNLIELIDRWVCEYTFSLLSQHPKFLGTVDFIYINLSGPSLVNDSFTDFVKELINSSKVVSEKICFEITETVAISNLTAANSFISELKYMGCKFALDDFGSGLSSFGYLRSLPVDYLKIDGIFVKDIVEDSIDRAMVDSINEIGHVMGKKTIAEFVENSEIIEVLKSIGVNYCQGYGIGKPVPLTDLLDP